MQAISARHESHAKNVLFFIKFITELTISFVLFDNVSLGTLSKKGSFMIVAWLTCLPMLKVPRWLVICAYLMQYTVILYF